MGVAPIFLYNLTVDDVVAILILNRIPPSWVAHGYSYSAQYIHKCIWANSMDSAFFQEVDAECLRCLQAFGVPDVIPEWVAHTFIHRCSLHLAPDRGGAEGHPKSLQEPLERGLAVIERRPIHSPGDRTLTSLPYLDTSG